MVSVLSSLGVGCSILTNIIVDEPVVYCNYRLEDGDNTLYTKPTPYTLNSRQLGDDAFNLEILPNLYNHLANECDNDYSISNDESTVTTKR